MIFLRLLIVLLLVRIITASMLSVDDVCDWVVHSLHMPEEVRDIMRDNAVTGYDFPDLVEHDGRLIETELGITKRNLRSRLYRGLVMRLMGMGTLPSDVLNVHTDSVSCHEVRLQWVVEQAERHGFPTHKYLVQRYETTAAVAHGSSASENLSVSDALLADPRDIDSTFDTNAPIILPQESKIRVPEWTVVCSDMATFCIDKGLAAGTKYMYRVSAWNAVSGILPRCPVLYNTTCAVCTYYIFAYDICFLCRLAAVNIFTYRRLLAPTVPSWTLCPLITSSLPLHPRRRRYQYKIFINSLSRSYLGHSI